MTLSDLSALLPILVIAVTAIALMLLIAVKRNHLATMAIGLSGIAISFARLVAGSDSGPRAVGPLLVIDQFASLYMGIILATSAVALLFAYGYLERQGEHEEEFYILFLLATLGGMVLVASVNVISLFLGLEILSIALYGLIAYVRTGERPREAAIKYLVLASSSAAFLLFGMSLIYEETGSLEFAKIAAAYGPGHSGLHPALLIGGAALALTGIGFKLALVPFHLWAPDVYEGAPLPVTLLIATVSKASVFGLILRWLKVTMNSGDAIWFALAVAAALSMAAGNILALLQTNVKRILAYSSIAHMGYFFVAVLAGGKVGLQAATYYLVAYLVTVTGAFGVLTILSQTPELCEIENYRGLFWRRPVLAGILTAMLLSLAGIPLTAGFLGKFYVLTAGVFASSWWLVMVLIGSSVIGLFYYLRIVLAMFSTSDEAGAAEGGKASLTGGFGLAAVTFLLFFLGLFPASLWQAIGAAVDSLHSG